MPFVKLRSDLVINTDYIRTIVIGTHTDPNKIILVLDNGDTKEIPPASLSWLLASLEVSTALLFDAKLEDFKVTLTSKVAQLLRDSFPQGATVKELTAAIDPAEISDWKEINGDIVYNALTRLEMERVAVVKDGGIIPNVWLHASHAPKPVNHCLNCDVETPDPYCPECTARLTAIEHPTATPSLDPLFDAAPQAASPAEDTEQTTDQTTGD